MATGKFVTAINCIDGRAHYPVKSWLQASFDAEFVDRITEPGVDKLLADGAADVIEGIKQQVLISVNAHDSKTVAVVGHHDRPGRSIASGVVIGQDDLTCCAHPHHAVAQRLAAGGVVVQRVRLPRRQLVGPACADLGVREALQGQCDNLYQY